jgi:outer membrane protein assembly factor BamB
VYALNRRTGKLIWSYDTGGPANQSPALCGNLLAVATATERLVLLNATTGDVIREFKLDDPAATPPVIALNRIYVEDTNRRLHCFGPKEE